MAVAVTFSRAIDPGPHYMSQQQQDLIKLRKRLNKFLSSYSACSEALARHGDFEELLDAGGGLCVIPDFLPPHVAEGVLALLEELPQEEWNVRGKGVDVVCVLEGLIASSSSSSKP